MTFAGLMIALLLMSTHWVANAAADSLKPGTAACAKVNKRFPAGVTESKRIADAAKRFGWKRPKVSLKGAVDATLLLPSGSILDARKDGVICPVPLLSATPTPVSGLAVDSVGETHASVRWDFSSDPMGDGTIAKITGAGSITIGGGFAFISGLNPGTTYEFLIVRSNAAGDSVPTTFSLTTKARRGTEIPVIPIPTDPPSGSAGPGSSVSPPLAGSSLYYRTCDDARSAGVMLPIREVEQPEVYRANPHLDRDRDGVSCES